MKRLSRVAVLCGIFMMMMGLAASLSMAGGVITYHLKIKNDTDKAVCSFAVQTYNQKLKKVDNLHASFHATVETNGGDCFVGFTEGSCYVPNVGMKELKGKCLVGGREPSSPDDCVAVACYSSDWFIRRDSSNGTYHFHRE